MKTRADTYRVSHIAMRYEEEEVEGEEEGGEEGEEGEVVDDVPGLSTDPFLFIDFIVKKLIFENV